MLLHAPDIRDRLKIARGAHLDGDPLVGDELDQGLGVTLLLGGGKMVDEIAREDMGAVADPLRVALGDGLKNGGGAISLPRMNGLL